MASIGGHELVHRKGFWHKFVGSLPFMTFFYTHFWDEHCNGHHKTVATPEDPVSAPKDRNFYRALVHAVIGTRVATWKREEERITKGTPGISKPMLFIWNRMVHYEILHFVMIYAIYKAFGFGGLKY